MILASGARGRGFNSRTAPVFFFFFVSCVSFLGRNEDTVQETGFDCLPARVHSSAVEHGIADPAVAGSIPAVP